MLRTWDITWRKQVELTTTTTTHTHSITEKNFISKYTTFVITYLFNYLKITYSAKSTNGRNTSGRHLNFFLDLI